MKAKKEVQEIQGTKQEFLKVFREMCYSRSAWQVWADLISMIACSLANSTDPDKPYFTMEWKNGDIVQCRGSHNCGMPPEVKAFTEAFKEKMTTQMRRCG